MWLKLLKQLRDYTGHHGACLLYPMFQYYFFMCNAGIKKEVNRLKIERETCQKFVLDVDEISARPALIQDVFVAQRKNIDQSISSNQGDKVWLTRQQKCRFNHYCHKNVQKINNKNRCLRLKVNFLPRQCLSEEVLYLHFGFFAALVFIEHLALIYLICSLVFMLVFFVFGFFLSCRKVNFCAERTYCFLLRPYFQCSCVVFDLCVQTVASREILVIH